MMKKPCLIVTGPTASGKSAYALGLAASVNGAIINADVMQLYSAFPVLTAQPDETDKAEAPHRLYGVLPPGQWCNAHQWRALALAEIKTVIEKGQTPILTGGTGFYLKALLEGIADIPAIPPAIRARITERLQAEGHEVLHRELSANDPASAAKIKTGDTQRLIRALEVFHGTGTALSDFQNRSRQNADSDYDFNIHILLPPREKLYAAIDARVPAMLEKGALDEVKALIHCPEDWPVYKAHGFREFRDYLSNKITLDEAIDKTRQVTRNYAKRQTTWARHQWKNSPCPVTVIEN